MGTRGYLISTKLEDAQPQSVIHRVQTYQVDVKVLNRNCVRCPYSSFPHSVICIYLRLNRRSVIEYREYGQVSAGVLRFATAMSSSGRIPTDKAYCQPLYRGLSLNHS